MARIRINAEFEPDPGDEYSHLGPKHLLETLNELGLYDLEILVDEEIDD